MLILNHSWAVWLAWALGAFYLVSAVLNLAGSRPMREGFARWGFPSWFHLANGALDLVVGLAILWYPTRPFGLALSLLVCVAVWITLARHRDLRHIGPSLALAALTLLAAWGLRLLAIF